MKFSQLSGLLSLGLLVVASPARQPRPLVIWHGLGDSYASPGMQELATLIQGVHPGIFIHSVYINEDQEADRRAAFYGNVGEQVDLVAGQLSGIQELQEGFDAIGFSQGGQFLRAYVERYNDPPVHNLITFGSQHMGISDIPLCRPYDILCQLARRAVKNGVYSSWAQKNLVQAQYFRDPENLETFLTVNHFLTDINNEVYPTSTRNATYAENLASLNNLVLIIFAQDKTVVPKESAWFGSEAEPEPDDDRERIDQGVFNSRRDQKHIIPMRLQPLYLEDWIGLRTLDEQDRVIFDACEGEHMHLGDCWERIVQRFVGGVED